MSSGRWILSFSSVKWPHRHFLAENKRSCPTDGRTDEEEHRDQKKRTKRGMDIGHQQRIKGFLEFCGGIKLGGCGGDFNQLFAFPNAPLVSILPPPPRINVPLPSFSFFAALHSPENGTISIFIWHPPFSNGIFTAPFVKEALCPFPFASSSHLLPPPPSSSFNPPPLLALRSSFNPLALFPSGCLGLCVPLRQKNSSSQFFHLSFRSSAPSFFGAFKWKRGRERGIIPAGHFLSKSIPPFRSHCPLLIIWCQSSPIPSPLQKSPFFSLPSPFLGHHNFPS